MADLVEFQVKEARVFSDARGDLGVIENFEAGFTSKRLFWISNVPGNAIRARHGHRIATQCLTGLTGKTSIEIFKDSGERFSRELMPNQYIIIPPRNLIELRFYAPSTLLIVQTDVNYDQNEMFTSFDELEGVK